MGNSTLETLLDIIRATNEWYRKRKAERTWNRAMDQLAKAGAEAVRQADITNARLAQVEALDRALRERSRPQPPAPTPDHPEAP